LSGDVVLRASGISRSFPGVQALKDVSLALRAGEVHALMGQNGAGKSTLLKVLTGLCRPDTGHIELLGERIAPRSPSHAEELGISAVHQESHLLPNVSVAENICAGKFPRRPWLRGGGIDWAAAHRDARTLVAKLGIDIDVSELAGSFPVAVQQLVAVARATSREARVLILDEPTSSLDAGEVAALFALLKKLRAAGVAILFVTHFLDQVYAICDRITVLRNGGFVGEYTPAELPARALVAAMVGRDLGAASSPGAGDSTAAASGAAPPAVAVKGLGKRGMLKPVDLEIHGGEIVGLAGLLGSGRTELASLIMALEAHDSGDISVAGTAANPRSPADALELGFGLCPEDRKADGLIAELSVRENIVLALQARQGLVRFISPVAQRELADRLIAALGIKTASCETPIAQLSGGNQQKAIIARWLATHPKLLILDEPTRGIDVAAKAEIMGEIEALASRGTAVLFISAEIEEVVRVASRIVVMRDRAKVGELPRGSSVDTVYGLIAQ
jgi:monosaccharide-transporting ATPase